MDCCNTNQNAKKEIASDLQEEQAEAKEQLCGLDFSSSKTAVDALVRLAIGYQKKIEVIDQIFEKIKELKEDSE